MNIFNKPNLEVNTIRFTMSWQLTTDDKRIDDLILIPQKTLTPLIKSILEKLIQEQLHEQKIERGKFYIYHLLFFPNKNQIEIYFRDEGIWVGQLG